MSDSILIVTPVTRGTNGRGTLFAPALRSHLSLEYSGVLETLTLMGGDDRNNGSQTVTNKYARSREIFLAGNWTHMLCLETDVVVPPDTISRLLDCEADIAYGLYCFRHDNNRWCAAHHVDRHSWKSVSQYPDEAKAAWGNIINVKGVGQGVTLIKRHVLEMLEFNLWKGVSCDWRLACEAQEIGFTQRCNTACIAGHITLLPSPMTLWPDINAENFIRFEYPD